MKLLSALRLLVSGTPPTSGIGAGATYFDSATNDTRVHDGSDWCSLDPGTPEDVAGYVVPAGRQVTYFDQLTNSGVLTIKGQLVGMR